MLTIASRLNVGSYVGESLTQIKTAQAYNHQPHERKRCLRPTVSTGPADRPVQLTIPKNQRFNSRCWLMQLAGIHHADWPDWNRMWRKSRWVFGDSGGMQARFRDIEWVSGGSLAAHYWWAWVKRAFIFPILLDVNSYSLSFDTASDSVVRDSGRQGAGIFC